MGRLADRLARLGRKAFSPEILDVGGLPADDSRRSDGKSRDDEPAPADTAYVDDILKRVPEVRRGIAKRAAFAADGLSAATSSRELEEVVQSIDHVIHRGQVLQWMLAEGYKYGVSRWRLVFDEKSWRLIDIVYLKQAVLVKTQSGPMWRADGQLIHPFEVVSLCIGRDLRKNRYEGLLEGAEDLNIKEKAQDALVNSLMMKRGRSGTIVIMRNDKQNKAKIDIESGLLEPEKDDPGEDEDALESGIGNSKMTLRTLMQKVGSLGFNIKPHMQWWSSTGNATATEPKLIHMPHAPIKDEGDIARQSTRRLIALTEVPLAILGLEEEVNAKGTLLVELLDFLHVVSVDRRKLARVMLQILIRSTLMAGYTVEPGDVMVSIAKMATFTSLIGKEVEQQLSSAFQALAGTGVIDPVWALMRIYDITRDEAEQAVRSPEGVTMLLSPREAPVVATIEDVEWEMSLYEDALDAGVA